MKIFKFKTSGHGQSAVEYLLILAVVATIVLVSFNTLIPAIYNSQNPQTSPNGFFTGIARAIIREDPSPIDGQWCQVVCPPIGTIGNPVRYRTCECPSPSFGGKYCSLTDAYSQGNVQCTGDKCACNGVNNPSGCIQQCSGKICGADGCGNSNGCGLCPPSWTCNPSGTACISTVSCPGTNEILNPIGNSCICAPNTVPDPKDPANVIDPKNPSQCISTAAICNCIYPKIDCSLFKGAFQYQNNCVCPSAATLQLASPPTNPPSGQCVYPTNLACKTPLIQVHDIVVPDNLANSLHLSSDQAAAIYANLQAHGYVDADGKITSAFVALPDASSMLFDPNYGSNPPPPELTPTAQTMFGVLSFISSAKTPDGGDCLCPSGSTYVGGVVVCQPDPPTCGGDGTGLVALADGSCACPLYSNWDFVQKKCVYETTVDCKTATTKLVVVKDTVYKSNFAAALKFDLTDPKQAAEFDALYNDLNAAGYINISVQGNPPTTVAFLTNKFIYLPNESSFLLTDATYSNFDNLKAAIFATLKSYDTMGDCVCPAKTTWNAALGKCT